MDMCMFCYGTKKIKVIDEPETGDQNLLDAIKKGQKIVEEDCPLCALTDKLMST
ncbi:hypothetical protein D3C74_478550 [compost metagenome]